MRDISELPDRELDRWMRTLARRVERAYEHAERLAREFDDLRAERQRRLCQFETRRQS